MTLENIEAVRTAIVSVVHHIDAKRWTELRSLYASEVDTDYTSLFGGTPQRQTGDALIAGWRQALATVATHHILGPIDVRLDGPTAHADAHVRGLHYAPRAPGGEHWEVLGHYVFELARSNESRPTWLITRMTLETIVQTGNTQLLAESSGAVT